MQSIHPSIRDARLDDIESMTRIYHHHVISGTGSFEETPPDSREMASRFKVREKTGHPTLVYEDENARVIGFAYAGIHKPRSAYRYTVEDAVYIDPAHTGKGVGFQLMTQLVGRCIDLGYQQMMAVIGDSENTSSIKLHKKLGFKMIGTAQGIGYKHGKWLDVLYMQLSLTSEITPRSKN